MTILAGNSSVKIKMLKVVVLVSVLFATTAQAITFPSIDECEVPNVTTRTERIFKGQISGLGEFPYAVLLQYSGGIGAKHYSCAGTLISERYVLTSAFCLTGMPSTWTLDNVILGEWDKTTDPDCVNKTSEGERVCAPVIQTIPVEGVIPHENFNSEKTLLNDIAIIRLAADAEFNKYVRPICLPLIQELINRNITGEPFITVGWGRTEENVVSNQQRKAQVFGVSTEACQELYKDETKIAITDTQICARNEDGQDACSEDSGAPLIGTYRNTEGKTFNYLAGIVSAGKGCGTIFPGVYTRVGSFISWIEKNTN